MAVTINGTTGITTPDIDSVDATFTGTVSGAVPAAIDVNASAPADSLAIDANGRLGIGETVPDATVHIKSSGSDLLDLERSGVGQYRLFISNSDALGVYDVGADSNRLVIDTSGNFQFNSGYGSVATAYGCRAWVNFNGTGTVAIRASGNVSSIDDNGTGNYTVSFTTSMPDANYCAVASTVGTTSSANNSTTVGGDYSHNASYFSFKTRHVNDYANDCNFINAAVFR